MTFQSPFPDHLYIGHSGAMVPWCHWDPWCLHDGLHDNGLGLARALLEGRPGRDLEGDGRGVHGVEAAVLQRRLDVHHGETHADAVQQLAFWEDGMDGDMLIVVTVWFTKNMRI